MNLFGRGQQPQQAQIRTQSDAEKELELFERGERLRIKESLFEERENMLATIKKTLKDMNIQIAENEHEYHEGMEQKNTELAKLTVAIDAKRSLLNELKDQKDEEISLLKSSNFAIISNYKEMIELLKTQVEVLTAKLTELKITDAHIHVDAKLNKE